jgi:REP element-mobilizing transposase RayT
MCFFQASDYHFYLKQLKLNCNKQGVDIWAYCLVTNHEHLIVNPKEELSLANAIGETHKHYTKMINMRERWSGYLWQGRFSSFPMDESYLLRAVTYVELNPMVAGMSVPKVLLNGDHAAIARWRMQQLGRTWQRRPDLLEQMTLTQEQEQSLAEFIRLTDQSER